MNIKMEGFTELQKELDKMQKAAENLDNAQIPIDDLLTNSFMKKYSNFSNFDEFLEAGNFVVNSQEDFEAIPENEMDSHVSKTTKFSSWDDMLGTAGEEYALKRIGFK